MSTFLKLGDSQWDPIDMFYINQHYTYNVLQHTDYQSFYIPDAISGCRLDPQANDSQLYIWKMVKRRKKRKAPSTK